MNDIDMIIVGSGFTGAVLARLLAEEQGKQIVIIERRSHIAGNMYDAYNSDGILEQRYGIHVFHTDKKNVFNYLSKFTEWIPYSITCLAEIDNELVGVPFNFECIDKFWSIDAAKRLKEKLLNYFPGKDRVPVMELILSEDKDIREFGNFLFEKDYKPYTCKQWGRKPEEIDISILNRVQVALSYDNRYFSNEFQYMPKNGFTKLFENILEHGNISICLNTDIRDLIEFDERYHEVRIKGFKAGIPVIYTGALDSLFGYTYGSLPYRTLRFEYKTYKKDYMQPAPFIVYPSHKSLTRVTEFKHVTGQVFPGVTTLVEEYPLEYNSKSSTEPFYPIITKTNTELYEKYYDLAKSYENLITCGRLADYRYYDMDNAIVRAFEIYGMMCKKKGLS